MYIHTTYCVPGLGLGTRDTAINKTDTVPFTLEEWARGTTRVSPPADGPVASVSAPTILPSGLGWEVPGLSADFARFWLSDLGQTT